MVPPSSLWLAPAARLVRPACILVKRLPALAIVGIAIAVLSPQVRARGAAPPSGDTADGAKEKRAGVLKHLLETFRSDAAGEEPKEVPIWESWLRRTGELPPDFDRLPANAFPPDLLTFQNGKPVTHAGQWAARRREIRGVLDQYMLGHWPPPPERIAIKYQASKTQEEAFVRQSVQLSFAPSVRAVEFAERIGPYNPSLTPENRRDRANHAVAILNVELFIPRGEGPFPAIVEIGPSTMERDLPRLQRGYVVARFSRLDADYIAAVYPDYQCNQLEWWAYAAGRCVDLLYARDDVDKSKIAVSGHSRGGKTAMLAAVMDKRVAALINSHPGTGAGTYNLWRYAGERFGGETLENSTRRFQYWNHPRMRFFIGRENKMPFDSHFLLALVAPRPALLGTGERDHVGQAWGDQQCYLAVKEVYKFLGSEDKLGFYASPGAHEVTPAMTNDHLDWLDMQFGRKPFDFKERLIYTYTFGQWKAITGEKLDPKRFPEKNLDGILLLPDGSEASTKAEWERKAEDIRSRIKQVIGDLPAYDKIERAALEKERRFGDRLVKAELPLDEKLVAHLTCPAKREGKVPVVIYLHAYLDAGGHEWSRGYGYRTSVGERLAQDGFLAIEFDQFGYASRNRDSGIEFYREHRGVSALGVMIQDVRRIVDAVSLLDWVDKERIMVAGYSLGGMVGLYAAAFDTRIRAVASTCGFGSMRLDAHGNRTEGIKRYSHLRPTIPRLGLFLGNERRIPYDFHEVLALIAPRSVFILAPRLDQDWVFEDVEACYREAAKVFALHGKRDNIVLCGPNDFTRYPPEYQTMVNRWLSGAHAPKPLPDGSSASKRGEGVRAPWAATTSRVEVNHAPQGTVDTVASLFGRTAPQWLARAPADAIAALPPGDKPDPDPIQGLESLAERHGHKPYDLFRRGDDLMTLRVIFQDRKFGTPVWMLDHSPTVDHCGTASIWPAWNLNASTLFVEGLRPLDGRLLGGWFFHSDFSRMRPSQGGRPAVWAPEDRDLFYGPASPEDHVACTNWRTGQRKVIAQWEPLAWPGSGKRVYGLTRDLRHIFVDLPNRGIFVPFRRDDQCPIPVLPLYDGRPIGPGGASLGGNHVNVLYGHPKYGDLIALRTGMLVDRKSGETSCVAVPLCGNTNYLRAFHENRVKYPQGDEWNAYGLPWFAKGVRLPVGLGMDDLYNLWRNIPHATHGHESPSPDWEHIAVDGGTTRIVRVRDAQTQSVRLSANGGNYHLHWRAHPRFFVGWVRGWHFGSYLRPEHANVEFQVFSDGTFQPIVDTKHRLNGYYAGGDFAMLSPDATKIHYGSSMTGRFRNYIAVMARPRPPAALSWKADHGAVVLAWEPSAYHHETRGYLVYRSQRSGGAYRLVTPEPVEASSWRDATVEPGRAYYYVVSSLEHSGLESGYSEEAARAGVDLPGRIDAPLVVYAEAEHAIRDLPTAARPGLAMGADRREASDWYYLYRHPKAERGEASLDVKVPGAGRYHVWARLRAQSPEPGAWKITAADHTLSVTTREDRWTWVRAGEAPLALDAGRLTIGLASSDAAAQLDLLCLTTDAQFAPRGPRPEDTEPPPAVEGLRVENVLPRVNRLTWQPSTAPGLAHYHVYAAREPFDAPQQRLRIGSPTEAELIDWGLQAGTAYYYAVTAVDRQGNESPIGRLASAATPLRRAAPAVIELHFANAELEGSFERSAAAGTRGEVCLIPQGVAANRANWKIDLPHAGRYYFWLRYLHRGSGGRGEEVSQSVRATIDGRRIAILGGGATDLHVPDRILAPGSRLAERLWTWAWPGTADLEAVELPKGRHRLTLTNLAPNIRYDALVITDEPAWQPPDGRLRQR